MTLEELEAKAEELQVVYNKARETSHRSPKESAALKQARAEVSKFISGGAVCPSCGSECKGQHHQISVRNVPTDVFEVGCFHCKDHRAQGFTVEQAQAAFAAGPNQWIPPKTAPTEALVKLWSAEKSHNGNLKRTVARWQ